MTDIKITLHTSAGDINARLFAALLDRGGYRRADAAPFVPEQREQPDRGATKFKRYVAIRGDAQRSEHHPEAGSQNHARNDDVDRADVEVQVSHPPVAGPDDQQPDRNQPARVELAIK